MKPIPEDEGITRIYFFLGYDFEIYVSYHFLWISLSPLRSLESRLVLVCLAESQRASVSIGESRWAWVSFGESWWGHFSFDSLNIAIADNTLEQQSHFQNIVSSFPPVLQTLGNLLTSRPFPINCIIEKYLKTLLRVSHNYFWKCFLTGFKMPFDHKYLQLILSYSHRLESNELLGPKQIHPRKLWPWKLDY